MKFHTKIQGCLGRNSFRKALLPGAFAVALLLAPGAASALPIYTFTGLGDLSGGTFSSIALGVSADGQTVVGQSQGAAGTEAFRWTASGGMQGLGLLPDANSSTAHGVSADGQIVVGTSISCCAGGPFLWTASAGMQPLGTLGSPVGGVARAVSASGQVIVGSSYGPANLEAFRWTASGGMQGVGNLINGDRAYEGSAVSADGDTVVGTRIGTLGHEAFRWTPSGGIQGLGDLSGGAFYSEGRAISADGNTVVGRSIVGSGLFGPLLEAYRWTQADGMTSLGTSEGPNASSVAYGVSGDGRMIVGSSSGGAFIWDTVHGMRSLQGVLQTDYGLNLDGWSLQQALAISPDGKTIVGGGLNPARQSEAWLVRLDTGPVDPLPATDIQYININSNGVISGESFNPAYPTVVVTHGWQPELPSLDPLSQPFPLSDVSGAVASRALAESQSLNLITYQWEGAYTEYNAAANGVSEAGLILGRELNSLFNGAGYTGGVHMIGHSLGAAVNAEAAHQPQALGIDQFTILDAPRDVPFDPAVKYFSEQWFNVMLRERQVTYVDNFYGDRGTAVGASILNAAPGGGLEVAYDHTTIHTDFYSPRIGGGDWVSPIFGLNATSFSGRPGPQVWDPLVLSDLTVAGDLNDFDGWPATSGFTEISTLSDLGIGGTGVTNDVMVLNPNSPVSISQHFDIPIDATLLSFDFGFLDPGTGEFLQLFFDDILLWEMPWMNDLVGEVLNAVVPIGSLAGLSGDLTFLLDSTNGNAQARAFLSNFEVMGSFARTAAVPEPGTLLLLIAGLLSLIRRQRKWAA